MFRFVGFLFSLGAIVLVTGGCPTEGGPDSSLSASETGLSGGLYTGIMTVELTGRANGQPQPAISGTEPLVITVNDAGWPTFSDAVPMIGSVVGGGGFVNRVESLVGGGDTVVIGYSVSMLSNGILLTGSGTEVYEAAGSEAISYSLSITVNGTDPLGNTLFIQSRSVGVASR